ncbi:methyltransferase family protein [Actibacterium sp. D379-3]
MRNREARHAISGFDGLGGARPFAEGAVMRSVLGWIDLPPVWLAVFAGLARAQATLLPVSGFGAWGDPLGAVLIGAGLAVMLAAAAQFLARRTTLIPRQAPSGLVQGGIYRLTRNPIYLGDVLVLAGLVLCWDAVPGLVLLPAFMALIQQRFILGEEAQLHDVFGAEFDAYRARVRRWL